MLCAGDVGQHIASHLHGVEIFDCVELWPGTFSNTALSVPHSEDTPQSPHHSGRSSRKLLLRSDHLGPPYAAVSVMPKSSSDPAIAVPATVPNQLPMPPFH